MIMLRVGIQVNPPLLQMYILPSGPSAAPLGPPGICATTSLRPSGQTRVSRLPRISTSTTEPSGITTGPSGNSRSVARTRISAMNPPGFSWAQADFQAYFRTRNSLVTRCYGKEDHACQPEDLRNRYYRGVRRRVVWPENKGKCTLSAYSYKYPTG